MPPAHSTRARLRLLLSIVSLTLAVFLVVRQAGRLPFFVDEVVNTQAALQFFTELDYRSPTYLASPFSPAVSTGLLASWPAALGWGLGGDIFSARLGLGFFSLAHFLVLAFWFCRRSGGGRGESLAFAAFAWMLLLALMPNWMNYIVNLGELASALWLATGFLLLRRWPRAAFFVLGASVWQGKFIYLPLVAAIGAAQAWEEWRGARLRFGSLAARGFFFVLPLLLWFGLILLRHGPEVGVGWLSSFRLFVGGNSGIEKNQVTGLWNRLTSPAMEWHTYAFGFRARVLLLLFLPYALAAASRRRWRIPLTACLLACLGFYTVWWFLWNPLMWFRHLQPALYLGFAFLGVFAWQEYRRVKQRAHAEWGLAAVSLLLLALVANATRKEGPSPYARAGEHYSRDCRDILHPPCVQ